MAEHTEVMAKAAVRTAVPCDSAAGPQHIVYCLEAVNALYIRRQGHETANAVHKVAIRVPKSDSCCYAGF